MLGRDTQIFIGETLEKISFARLFQIMDLYTNKTFRIVDFNRGVSASSSPDTLGSMHGEMVPYKTERLFLIRTDKGSLTVDGRSDCILAFDRKGKTPEVTSVYRVQSMYLPHYGNGTMGRAYVKEVREVPVMWSPRVFTPLIDDATLKTETRWHLITASGIIVRVADRAT